MRRTNKVYLVTWSYPGGAWNVVRAYVDTKAQARKAAKDAMIKESETGTGCAFCTRYRGRKVATVRNA